METPGLVLSWELYHLITSHQQCLSHREDTVIAVTFEVTGTDMNFGDTLQSSTGVKGPFEAVALVSCALDFHPHEWADH